MTNGSNKVFYIGVTNNIVHRTFQHKNNLVDGFTKRYNIKKLVYCESTNDIGVAIAREKQLKNWHRNWKIRLIENFNPEWRDLSEDMI